LDIENLRILHFLVDIRVFTCTFVRKYTDIYYNGVGKTARRNYFSDGVAA